jgi:hypothetical protein
MLEVGASEKMIFHATYGPRWCTHPILLCFAESSTSTPEKRFTITTDNPGFLLPAAIQPPS